MSRLSPTVRHTITTSLLIIWLALIVIIGIGLWQQTRLSRLQHHILQLYDLKSRLPRQAATLNDSLTRDITRSRINQELLERTTLLNHLRSRRIPLTICSALLAILSVIYIKFNRIRK